MCFGFYRIAEIFRGWTFSRISRFRGNLPSFKRPILLCTQVQKSLPAEKIRASSGNSFTRCLHGRDGLGTAWRLYMYVPLLLKRCMDIGFTCRVSSDPMAVERTRPKGVLALCWRCWVLSYIEWLCPSCPSLYVKSTISTLVASLSMLFWHYSHKLVPLFKFIPAYLSHYSRVIPDSFRFVYSQNIPGMISATLLSLCRRR